jgi:3-dehydroquinate synthase
VFGPLASAGTALHEAGVAAGTVLVVTDSTVADLWLDPLLAALRADGRVPHVHIVPAGESAKSMARLAAIHDWALGLGIDRQTPVVALGGGVVGDLAGFAAATLLRGLLFVQVPTTVIAQVDSAVGGKTGVNHAAGKNLLGAFHQPALVYVDPSTLDTLPDRDLRSGFAEVVKHALLSSSTLAERLRADWDALLGRDAAVLPGVLCDAVAIKADIVAADEREAGVRAFLNLGHTFGHAIERAAGYGAYTHGEAVAMGLRAALHLSGSVRQGAEAAPDAPLPADFAEADRLVLRLAPPPLPPDLTTDALMTAMGTDKKRTAEGLRFVVLDAPGAPRVVSGVPETWVRAAWAFVRQPLAEHTSA